MPMPIEAQVWDTDWQPTSNWEVTQLLNLLRESRADTTRFVDAARAEIESLSNVAKDAEQKHENLTNRVQYILQRYLTEVVPPEERKETATTIKLKLPRGEIVVTKADREIVRPKDDSDLQKAYPDFVKQTPSFEWGKFKKSLRIEGNKVLDSEGKVAPVMVVDTPMTTVIKLADNN